MDNSTDNVMVMGAFFHSVMDIYKEKESVYRELQRIVNGLDLSVPNKMHPMAKYNELLDWIDHSLGAANAKITGKSIGQTVFDFMVSQNMIKEDASASDIMNALVQLANVVISDPKKRGWVILVNESERLVMRKTQTFNTNVQFGVLEGLLYKCKKFEPRM
ncbi:MAG: hypothetical protein HC906_07090 [Bacteroidales bacterium]|nr:hypothetical protein [Bacteroidales bacterium]